jgi:2-iminoacetate synthase
MKPLSEILNSYYSYDVKECLENREPKRVITALSKPKPDSCDFALFLSPGSDSVLEQMAQKAHKITKARFGNVVNLYAPVYISNHCTGNCPYCGFKRTEKIKRKTLTPDEIEKEAIALKQMGIRHALLVSGDAPKKADFNLTYKAVKIFKKHFTSVQIEIAPLTQSEYSSLTEAGIDGVTLYQETYDRNLYHSLHKNGPKDNYDFRLEALCRAGEAGMRKLNIGALLGLAPYRKEALMLGFHARHLEKTYWKSQILIGMPRLHNVPDDFTIPNPVSDKEFAHIIIALRIFLNDAGIVVSTRETASFRDKLLPLGVTQFSAGSKTDPGGYAADQTAGKQFSIDDTRSPFEVQKDLLSKGYDPVFKDWDPGFCSKA